MQTKQSFGKEASAVPPKVISPRRALVIECLLFLAYAFFSASWMVGSIVTTDMCRSLVLPLFPLL